MQLKKDKVNKCMNRNITTTPTLKWDLGKEQTLHATESSVPPVVFFLVESPSVVRNMRSYVNWLWKNAVTCWAVACPTMGSSSYTEAPQS